MFKLIVLIGLVGWGSAAILQDLTEDVDCDRLPCSLEEKHVLCTSNGDNHKVFETDCELEKFNCLHKNKRFAVVPVSECLQLNIFPKPIKVDIEAVSVCEIPCDDSEMPVCGFNGEYYQIFDNSCIMGKQTCVDQHAWSQQPMRTCLERDNQRNNEKTECPEICPTIYRPVCGAIGHNFTLFSNQCELERANCNSRIQYTKIGLKRCMAKEEEKENCPKGCPRNYDPVCAFNGEDFKIFANDCLVTMENCENHQHWTVRNRSYCPELIEE